jgi:hypothetical protein
MRDTCDHCIKSPAGRPMYCLLHNKIIGVNSVCSDHSEPTQRVDASFSVWSLWPITKTNAAIKTIE